MPFAIVALAGVTAIDFNVAEVTVSVAAGLLLLPSVAVIVVDPALRPLVKPEPTPMVATLLLDEVQVVLDVTFCVLPSLKVPVAMNCCVPFLAMEAVAGVTAMDCNVAEVPVNGTAGLTTLPSVAVIWVVPGPWPTARPVCAPMEATEAFEVAQVTSAEMSCVLPSLKVPVAANCWLPFAARETPAGVTAIEFNVALEIVSVDAGLTMPV